MDWHAADAEATALASTWADDAPGGAILLFHRDGRTLSRCGGLARLEDKVRFGPDTPTRWASITKHLFAALILAGEGGVGLADPLGQHLDDLHPALGRVSVGRALDMTGGLPDVVETLWLLGVPFTAGLDRTQILRFLAALTGLNFEPGTEISYSNTGYRLVEEALRRRGIEVMDALRRRFGALVGGMDLPEDWSVPVPGLASGYYRTDAGWRRCHYGLNASASGGLVGSASDLARWLAALLRDTGATSGLLAALSAPRRLADGRPTAYGLGLRRTRLGGSWLLGHPALLPGFCGHILMEPVGGAGVIVLSNRADADPFWMASRVMGAGLGEALPERAAGLPSGLFIDSGGTPLWIELKAGQVSVLGSTLPLYGADDGWADSGAAQLPVRIRPEGDAIVGSVAFLERRFDPVGVAAPFDAAHEGLWHCADQNGWLRIAGGRLETGAGALRSAHDLQPLGPDHALFSTTHGPWSLRGCVHVEGDRLRLVSERSRALVFARAG